MQNTDTEQAPDKTESEGVLHSFTSSKASGYGLIAIVSMISIMVPFLPLKTIVSLSLGPLLGVRSAVVIEKDDMERLAAIQINIAEGQQVLLIPNKNSVRLYIGGSGQIIRDGGIISLEGGDPTAIDQPTKDALDAIRDEVKQKISEEKAAEQEPETHSFTVPDSALASGVGVPFTIEQR